MSSGVLHQGRRLASIIATIALVVASLGLSGATAQAATTIVIVGQTNGGGVNGVNQFNAASIVIVAGDTVTWNSAPDARSHDAASYSEAVAGTPDWQSPTLRSSTTTNTYSRVFSTAGTYTYYCSLHTVRADAAPAVVDANIALGLMVGKIVVNAPAADLTAPTVSLVAANPNPTAGAASVTLTATVADGGTPLGTIAGAEYSAGLTAAAAGSGTAMTASDGAFGGSTEGVTASVNVSTYAAGTTVALWVRGRDNAGNWSLAISTSLSVTAPAAGSQPATVTITGGTLTSTSYPIPFGSIGLTGQDLVVLAPLVAYRAIDGRGTGTGWNVTVSSTDFSSATGGIAVANFKVRLAPSNIVKIAGNTPPTSLATSFQPLGLTSLRLLSAGVGQGMGTYDYTNEWQLSVPGQTMAGSYTATVVISVNTGP